MYVINKKESRAEIVVKKSRFIASIFYLEKEEEVKDKINKIRKEFYDAKHHCYAYIIGDNKKQSDDGEPQGTGGKPILSLIEGKNMTDTLIVVSRIFGGILLGTGGLTHAYQDAAKASIETCVLKEKISGYEETVRIKYDMFSKTKSTIESFTNSKILSTEYGDIVSIKYNIDEKNEDVLKEKLTNITSGSIEYIDKKKVFYII